MPPSHIPYAHRRAIATDPNASLETLATLAANYPSEVGNNPGLMLALAAGQEFVKHLQFGGIQALLKCRDTPADLLLYLVGQFPQVPIAEELARQALSHPNLPPEALPIIERHAATGLYNRPARHLARHQHQEPAWVGDPTSILTDHLQTTPFAFTSRNFQQITLLPDWVVTALKQNPNIRKELDEWLDLQERRRQSNRLPQVTSASTYPSVFANKLLVILDQHPNPKIIEHASTDSDPDVRLATAHNPNIERATLESLTRDPDLPTAQAAARTLQQQPTSPRTPRGHQG